MNVDNSHWICITADGYNRNSVNIFDCRRTETVSTQTKEVIANLLQCESCTIYITYPPVQQQSNGASCGLFALAFAYSICDGDQRSLMNLMNFDAISSSVCKTVNFQVSRM